MKLIAVADIFGRTHELEVLIAKLSHQFSEIHIVDPYGGDIIHFIDEDEAYSCFQKTCGLTRYAQKVLEVTKNKSDATLLLGFSVGAAAIWKISHRDEFHNPTKMIGFYGSQIRNQLNINPRIEINLFFPKSENHFDVTALLDEVSVKKHVHCFQTNYLHGFMNQKSKNFSAEAYDQYLNILNRYSTDLYNDFSNAQLTKSI